MSASQLGYTPGSGANVATDLDGGAHHQKALIEHLQDGVPTPASRDDPLPVSTLRAEDLLVMLSRVVKLLESNAVVDSAQRQRISLDAIAAGVALPTVTTVTGVTTVTTVATVSSVTNVAANAGMDREQYINIAKQTYGMAIRPQLTFQ
jgi:hypothetical protein